MRTNEPVPVEAFINSLSVRELRDNNLRSQLPAVRAMLDQIEAKATSGRKCSLSFAASVLQEALVSDDPSLQHFATAFIAHLSEEKPISGFLGDHPDCKGIDMTWLIERRPEYARILEPLREVNLVDILNQAISPELSNGSGKQALLERSTNHKTSPSFEEMKTLYPVISDVSQDDEKWVAIGGKEYLGLQDLCSLFEKNEPSKDEDANALAVYQAINANTGLLNKFFETTRKYNRASLLKIEGRRGLYCPRGLVSDFLVFCADKLSAADNRVSLHIKMTSSQRKKK